QTGVVHGGKSNGEPLGLQDRCMDRCHGSSSARVIGLYPGRSTPAISGPVVCRTTAEQWLSSPRFTATFPLSIKHHARDTSTHCSSNCTAYRSDDCQVCHPWQCISRRLG